MSLTKEQFKEAMDMITSSPETAKSVRDHLDNYVPKPAPAKPGKYDHIRMPGDTTNTSKQAAAIKIHEPVADASVKSPGAFDFVRMPGGNFLPENTVRQAAAIHLSK